MLPKSSISGSEMSVPHIYIIVCSLWLMSNNWIMIVYNLPVWNPERVESFVFWLHRHSFQGFCPALSQSYIWWLILEIGWERLLELILITAFSCNPIIILWYFVLMQTYLSSMAKEMLFGFLEAHTFLSKKLLNSFWRHYVWDMSYFVVYVLQCCCSINPMQFMVATYIFFPLTLSDIKMLKKCNKQKCNKKR